MILSDLKQELEGLRRSNSFLSTRILVERRKTRESVVERGKMIRILVGDCRDVLRTLPAESVHCVVTSPPYWGLRDYGHAGQIGLEASYPDFVEAMVGVFRDVRRVLNASGTLWLNLGDSYATGAGAVGKHPGGGAQGARWRGDARPARNGRGEDQVAPSEWAGRPALGANSQFLDRKVSGLGPMTQPNRMPQLGLKSKDLCGIPWRVAFALQADGWYLRQDIIWSKPNPMPESVTDRCTKAHEYLFLLSKSERYYFDADSIKEAAVGVNEHDATGPGYDAPGQSPQRGSRSGNKERKPPSARGVPVDTGGKTTGDVAGFTRNKRSVWTVGTAPFSEAHFATFPPALIEPCIKAGCPAGGTVLDPFGGAGTTGLVADRLGRDAILIELNPVYAEMADRRIRSDGGMLSTVTVEG